MITNTFKLIGRIVLLLSLLFAFPIKIYAKSKATTQISPHEVPTNDAPGLTIDADMSDKIYQQSQATSKSTKHDAHNLDLGFAIDSSLRLFIPSQFELNNRYFRVSYSENSGNIVGIQLGSQFALADFNNSKLSSFIHGGYAYAQGIYNVKSSSGLDVKDAVELQWIPLQAGLEWSSHSLTSQRLTLGMLSSGGMDWYTQSGQLDGMNQTFWVPRYEGGAVLTLFAPENTGSGGFEGLRLTTVYYSSFASTQVHRGVAGDFGTRYVF